MRARVEAGGLELSPNVAERSARRVADGQTAPGNQPIDVEHPEPDGFHMERPDGNAERRAFPEERLTRCALQAAPPSAR